MPTVSLRSETDFNGWRAAARALRTAGVEPGDVDWTVGQIQPSGFGEAEAPAFDDEPLDPFSASRQFVSVAQAAICHRDQARFDLLYRLLLRLKTTPRLLDELRDPDVAELRRLTADVARACQRMKAFLRFRLVDEEPETYAAWCEPPHRVLQRTAPFFVERFSRLRFMILTPEAGCSWDGRALTFTTGERRNPLPARVIPDLTD
jgi:uracil-DNA glycosylase